MRFTLPESAPRRQRSLAGAILSASLHATVIGGTLVATGISAEPTRRAEPRAQALVYVRPLAQPPRIASPARTPPRPIVRPPQDPPLVVPPTAVVSNPAIVPTALPPISEPLGAPFDSTASLANPAGDGRDGASVGAPDGGDTPMSAFSVDREVVALKGVTPRYPGILANAGVEGTVVMQFVVDTLGRVERGSIRAMRADQALFEESVREALARMRFVPAEAGGRKVRQLVEQPFTFALGRR